MVKVVEFRWSALCAQVRHRLRALDVFSTREVPPGDRQGIKMFWLNGLFGAIAAAFSDTYLSLYALALGATNAQIGTLSSASSLLGTLAPIPGAQLAERWGKRKLVVSLFSGWLFRTAMLGALLVPFFLSGQAAIYAVIALFALRTGFVNMAHPAWVSLSADLVPLKQRGQYFSSRNVVMALASMLFVPLAGQVIDWGGDPHGYQWSLGLSVLFGGVAIYFWSKVPEPAYAASSQGQKARIPFWRPLVDNRTFLLFALIAIAWNFALQLGGPFFSVYQVVELGSTPRVVGLLSMVSGISRLVGHRFWGHVVDRRGSRWVLTLCALSIPLLPWIWALTTRPWHILFASLPGGFLWAGFELGSFNLLLELPSQEQRTQATAGYTTLVGLANIAGPLVGGRIIDSLGYRWDFFFSGCGRLAGALLFLWLLKPFAFKWGKRRL